VTTGVTIHQSGTKLLATWFPSQPTVNIVANGVMTRDSACSVETFI
jgi:hypothetical protein